MIKVDTRKGVYEIEGSAVELLTEITQIMRILCKNGILDDQRIMTLVRLALAPDKEIHKEAMEIIMDHIKEKKEMEEEGDVLTKFFGDILGEE